MPEIAVRRQNRFTFGIIIAIKAIKYYVVKYPMSYNFGSLAQLNFRVYFSTFIW